MIDPQTLMVEEHWRVRGHIEHHTMAVKCWESRGIHCRLRIPEICWNAARVSSFPPRFRLFKPAQVRFSNVICSACSFKYSFTICGGYKGNPSETNFQENEWSLYRFTRRNLISKINSNGMRPAYRSRCSGCIVIHEAGLTLEYT